MMNPKPPIRPERIRVINKQSFAFIPHRFLRDGFFASLSHKERSLYLFLVLAGDRNGVSFYHYDRICTLLEISLEEYIDLRNALIRNDLLAYDGTSFQILSLPERPLWLPTVEPISSEHTTDSCAERNDPAEIRLAILKAIRSAPNPDFQED